MAWQKLIKPGRLQLWTSWWLCCLWSWLVGLGGGQILQERGTDDLEIGGTEERFCKTPG